MDWLLLRGVGGRICFVMVCRAGRELTMTPRKGKGLVALAIEVGMSISEASCLWYCHRLLLALLDSWLPMHAQRLLSLTFYVCVLM